MTKENLNELLNLSDYQVFLFCCPANIPCNIAMHPWFICNEKGKISRWEVLFKGENKNHLFQNAFSPFEGIDMLPFSKRFCWKAKLAGQTKGDLAKRMIDFIKASPENYPHSHKYSLLGPNSNTYIQWILDHFPEFKTKLPWNAFGKNHKKGQL